MKGWSRGQIEKHREAAKLLGKVKDEGIAYIGEKRGVTEWEVQQFLVRRFRHYGLKTDGQPPIVGFNGSAATPHYFPKRVSRKLTLDSLILIDIWARLNESDAPFADMTWMAYHGKKISPNVMRVFETVIRSRDVCLRFVRSKLEAGEMPRGEEADRISKEVIIRGGYGKHILHSTGHSLGFTSPHGVPPYLNQKNGGRLLRNVGYTIEPGVYLKDKFGVRSEIDFFIDRNMKLVVTTDVQKKIDRVDCVSQRVRVK